MENKKKMTKTKRKKNKVCVHSTKKQVITKFFEREKRRRFKMYIAKYTHNTTTVHFICFICFYLLTRAPATPRASRSSRKVTRGQTCCKFGSHCSKKGVHGGYGEGLLAGLREVWVNQLDTQEGKARLCPG